LETKSYQVVLVRVMVILHNFIRRFQDYEDYFDRNPLIDEDRSISTETIDAEAEAEVTDAATARALNSWRDGIANSMWRDYQLELETRALTSQPSVE
jgi:hypothetical protein